MSILSKQKTDTNQLNYIFDYRTSLMGISIIAILLYHAYSWVYFWAKPESYHILNLFKYGFAGVDIFMFLSGYGLCLSYSKYPLSVFYIRRLLRIFPLYIITGLIVSFLPQTKAHSLWDIICNITTLSYYEVGGVYWNWFIPAIVLLYITFPLLFWFSRRGNIYFFLIINIAIIILLNTISIPWEYDCLISRIPIFCYGILVHINIKKTTMIKKLFLINTLFFIISCSYGLSDYYITATFCPILLFVLFYLKDYILTKNINRVGTYTLELFLGNSLVFYIMRIMIRFSPNNISLYLFLVFSFFTISISIIFIFLNKSITKYTKKIHIVTS